MQAIEWREHKDREKWEDGPWKDEPDKAQWTDESTGLACLIVRGPFGALCGYVGVSDKSKFYERGYDDVYQMFEDEFDVHGGLTFAGLCADSFNTTNICHLPEAGDEDPLWWLGFDCSHAWDASPTIKDDGSVEAAALRRIDAIRRSDNTYRDFEFVKREVQSLAKQIAEADGETHG